MQKITTFLWFDKEAEEAAKFYVSIFPKSRIKHVSRYGESGPGKKGSAMTVSFVLAGQEFIALNGGKQKFQFNEAISMMVNCKDQKEVDRLWSKLTRGGGEPGPCGWLKDRYGLSWQIIPEGLGALVQHPRAMEAMLKMSKIDLARLQKAAGEKTARRSRAA